MRVMVLEDDLLISELIQSVVGGTYPAVQFAIAERVSEGLHMLAQSTPDLLIADWNLPDGHGLEVIRQLRSEHQEVPILVITARADRKTVTDAARYRINGYLAKPFQIEQLQERLRTICPPPIQLDVPESLQAFFEAENSNFVQLPVAIAPHEIVELLVKADTVSVDTLEKAWKSNPGLLARLLDVANSASFRRSGEPCRTPLEALRTLGVKSALNYALALSLDVTHALTDKRLLAQAERSREAVDRLVKVAAILGQLSGIESSRCQLAARLHSVGDLSVLSICQRYLSAGGKLDSRDLDDALTTWSEPLGNRLTLEWRLPLELRDTIGACYALQRGTVKQELILMRAAALAAAGKVAENECVRLLNRLGIDTGKAAVLFEAQAHEYAER